MSVRLEIEFASVEEFEAWAQRQVPPMKQQQAMVASEPQNQAKTEPKKVGRGKGWQWTKHRVRVLRKLDRAHKGNTLGLTLALGDKFGQAFDYNHVEQAQKRFCQLNGLKKGKSGAKTKQGLDNISKAAKRMHEHTKDYMRRHKGVSYAEARRIIAGLAKAAPIVEEEPTFSLG